MLLIRLFFFLLEQSRGVFAEAGAEWILFYKLHHISSLTFFPFLFFFLSILSRN
jgi:hypothetical protein